MEYHDPLNASLVLPFQRPRDGRSTLPILPSLPQLGLLRCREPNPRRHHGTPPSPRKIRRCCADRLNPPRQGGHKRPREAESFTDRNTSGITLSSRCRSEEAAQFVRSLLRNFLWKEMTGVERSAMDIVCPSLP